jgi:predicted TIM-barrel fold metal-dependent hydrolase
MIIDVHGHITAPSELGSYNSGLLAALGAHGRGRVNVSDDRLREATEQPARNWGNISHLQHLDEAQIDVQLVSPRPISMMHSEEPANIVQWHIEETNNLIYRVCTLYPDRFRPVCGLPQAPSRPPSEWVSELRRCVQELGFVGALVNPDPTEGKFPPAPGMGDPYWYPIYEALCELDVPALVHPTRCFTPAPGRDIYTVHFLNEETTATWSLMHSKVAQDFPDLKLIISHGGGSLPYQIGRFLAFGIRRTSDLNTSATRAELDAQGGPAVGGVDTSAVTAYERLRTLYFDTCLYTQPAIDLLLQVAGPDRCMFGSEKPGTGSQRDPETGKWLDDIKYYIDNVGWLGSDERFAVYEGNAAKLFRLGDLAKV